MAIQQGRWTDDHDGPVVVFLIGMTVNRWWRVDLWWPVFVAMPRMLAELSRDRDSGLLGFRTVIGSRGPTVIQYWASTEQLIAYARDTDRGHRPAWSAFNRRVRESAGAVGIWHETYDVPAGAHESIYHDAPQMGLARATSAARIGAGSESATERLARPA